MPTPEEIEQERIAKEEAEKAKNKPNDPVALAKKNEELLAELKTLREKEAKAEQERKEALEKEMKEKNDWKGIAELREKEKKDADAKAAALQASVENGLKTGALSSELEKLGIISERKSVALKLVNIDDIKIDPSTKVVINAVDVAKVLHSTVPELFGKDAERMPNGQAADAGLPSKMTLEWYEGLNAADKKKHYKAFMESQGVKIKK